MILFNNGQKVKVTQAHNQFEVSDKQYTVGRTDKLPGQRMCMLMEDGVIKGAIPQEKLTAAK